MWKMPNNNRVQGSGKSQTDEGGPPKKQKNRKKVPKKVEKRKNRQRKDSNSNSMRCEMKHDNRNGDGGVWGHGGWVCKRPKAACKMPKKRCQGRLKRGEARLELVWGLGFGMVANRGDSSAGCVWSRRLCDELANKDSNKKRRLATHIRPLNNRERSPNPSSSPSPPKNAVPITRNRNRNRTIAKTRGHATWGSCRGRGRGNF